ncbi:MAG: toxin TcdB middle/N-terminal domain-containing protein [Verrucomicrobiota bacterium]
MDDWTARYSTFINDMKEELVPQANGDFFCKNESAFTRYRRFGGAWEGTLPDGSRSEFGPTPGGRIADGTNKIFCWMIEREMDTRGNSVVYSYTNFPGSQNTNQIYLSEIRYGPGSPPWNQFHFLRFEYEDRPDWFEDCRSGFIVRTGKRLKTITVATQGPALAGHLAGDFNQDGTPDCLIRRYDLEYLDYAGTNTHWSLLARVTPVGADGSSALPSSTFGYAVCNPANHAYATNAVILSLNEPTTVMDNPLAELIDLNGDGLPDILRTFAGGAVTNRGYLNRGLTQTNGSRFIQWAGGIDLGGDARASSYALSSNTVHLADMDGDGLSDLVVNSFNDTVFYFTNRANLTWGTRQTMSIQDTAPPSPFGSADVRTADLDFDKRIDIIQSVSSGGGVDYRVWFNIGHNQYSQRLTASCSNGFLFSQAGAQIADFNGDRVPDLARIGLGSVSVMAGLGYGRFAPPVSVPIPEGLDTFQRDAARLQDITGDGLADLVVERATPGTLYYWVNLGNYRFSPRKIITGLPSSVGVNAVVRWADLDGNGSTDLIYADAAADNRLRMVNLGEVLNCGASPNILTAISNGIGRVTLIGYAASTKYALEDAAGGHAWTNVMPFPVQVVSSVTNLDSLGHQYVAQFRYHDGYYDPVEKQFRGFGHVEQVEVGDASAPTLVTRSYFDIGRDFEAMKGKLLRLTSEQEDGRAFTDDSTAWTIPPVTLYTGTNGIAVQYAHPVGHTNFVKELGQGTERRLESEMDFDNYGNQTRQADYGIVVNGDRSAFNDERITTTEYAVNTNAWILRIPCRQEIKDENGAVISRSQYFYDDETFSGSNPCLVTIGNLTLKREWKDPANAGAFIQSARTKYDSYGNPTTILDPLADAAGFAVGHAREIAYDTRFHTYPVTETIHLGSGSTPLIFQASYDEGFGTVVSSTDFNTNTTTYSYDTFARLISIVKPGDTPTYPTVEYDYALAVPFPLPLGEGQGEGLVNYIETRQLDKPPASAATKRDHYLLSRQFVDGLGRKLLTKQEAEPAPGGSSPRVVVSEATQFNARQKPSRTLNPFFSLLGGSLEDLLAFENIETSGWQGQFQNDGSLLNLGLASAHATRTDYDATLRPTQVANPDGTQRRTAYEPLLTRSFDENDTDFASPNFNTPMAHYNDGLGRLIQVDEVTRLSDDGTPAGALHTWTTRYEYDLNDQLTRITDSQANIKTFGYDGLKRKTDMNDPDRGLMHFVYDDASNLTETTDAKAQRITYSYDGANRILTEDYHDGLPLPAWRGEGQGEGFDVIYHYDSPVPSLPQGDTTTATARNTRGTLAWVEDLSGEEHTSCDSRGRVEWTVKRIPDPLITDSRSLITYTTRFAYDSLDRVTSLTYPDNDQISYEYNERSLLRRIPGGPSGSIISNLVYQPSAQNGQIDYGNGVRTTYAYDSRLRLTSLITYPASRITEPLINFSYDFDPVSNIKSITDGRPVSQVPATDPRRNTQLFQYDDLYRITQAQYNPGSSGTNTGLINYRYDRIGNMLAQTSTINQQENGLPVANLGQMDSGGSAGRSNRTGRTPSDPPGPHALTSIRNTQYATRIYPYDANGNMTTIDGLACTWDFKDRLVAVENTQMRAAYTYDFTDRRIIKRVQKKSHLPGGEGQGEGGIAESFTTIYVNKYFEVREHDAPTKYVWNGSTRVAHVTGSLSTNIRVQRLRLYPGWNLVSLAVTTSASDLQSQIPDLQSFRWNSTSQTWTPVGTGEMLVAGTILWLQATTNATLAITGPYADPTNRTVAATGDFLPSAGLEAWDFTSAISNVQSATASTYEGSSAHWLSWLPQPLELQSDLPAFIAPGQAVFARADALAQLEVPDSALRIRYYHQDHLGSSSVLADGWGNPIDETANYPFGFARHNLRSSSMPEHYAFAQKEKDHESALMYFEARYYLACLGRFNQCDPLCIRNGLQSSKQNPSLDTAYYCSRPSSRMNPYAYSFNNPNSYADPSGLAESKLVEADNLEKDIRAVMDDSSSDYELGSKGRSLNEQLKFILNNRSQYKTDITKEFKGMPAYEKLTETQQAECLKKMKGLQDRGFFPHVGNRARDIQGLGDMDIQEKTSVVEQLRAKGYTVLPEIASKGKFQIVNDISKANVLHVQRSSQNTPGGENGATAPSVSSSKPDGRTSSFSFGQFIKQLFE